MENQRRTYDLARYLYNKLENKEIVPIYLNIILLFITFFEQTLLVFITIIIII